jgi:GT2 family glycosyltransferase
VARIRSSFARDPGLAAVFGSYDDDPASRTLVSRFRNLLHHHVHQSAAGPVRSFWTGLGAVRRDAFEAVSGFNERRQLISVEDIELGMELSRRGERILLDPDVLGTHLKRWTLASMVQTDFARRGMPWVELLLRRRELPTTLNLGWSHRFSAASTIVLALGITRRRPRTAVAATAALVTMNMSFYALLARRGGLRLAAAGVPLHALHLLTAVAAVPAGVVAHLADFMRQARGRVR